MIPFALISILLFFINLKERTKRVYVLIACIVLVLSVIAFLLGSNMEGVVISTVLSVYIAFLLFLPKTNQATLAITIISAIVTILIQISTICKWFNNYDLIYSGDFPEIPLEVADRMFVTGFNEIGMAIIVCCLICLAFSIQCNMSKETQNEYSTTDNQDIKKSKIKFCRKCGFELIDDSEFCSQCGTEIVIMEPTTIKKCELCNKETTQLYYCEIKDECGTRYRNICGECISKHGAKVKENDL
ncbi:MAG: zinc ribbon domain-containing protein [Clostridia bacterium]|nr:zinc ribbon domain-containing protein [Clostridia bacterium]